MSGAALRLGRVSLRVRSAGAPDWPAQWRDTTRFCEETTAALDAALADILDPADPSVWVIRRLELEAVVDGAGGAAAAAESFSRALRRALARVLQGAAGEGVLRFPDRAAWLAQLLVDLARGDGFDHWRNFSAARLRPLPTDHAMAQAMLSYAPYALDALARLDASGELGFVLAALGESGARRALAALVEKTEPSAPPPRLAPTLAPQDLRAALRQWGDGARLRLALAASAARAEPASFAAAPLLAALEQRIAETRRGLARPPPSINADVESGRTATGRDDQASMTRTRRVSAPTAQEPSSTRRQVMDVVAAPIRTPFAGLFLLWRSVRELGLDELLPEGAAGARARLTLCAALAGRRWRLAFDDPALRWLAGAEPDAPLAPARPPKGLAADFAAHMRARAAPRDIATVEQRALGFRVSQDARSEDWLLLARARDAEEAAAAGFRPLARDLDYFGLPGREAAPLPWILLARAAFGDLGRRLMGLDRSSAAWLAANVTPGEGWLDPGPRAEILLPRAPLNLLLRMAGLDGATLRLADGRALRLRLPGAG